MGKPPQLTPEQRSAALLKASQSRQVRAGVKAKVKQGDLSIADVLQLAATDGAVAKMRVAELFESISGVGKVRAQGLMAKLKISPTRRVQGLGKHQLLALAAQFESPLDKSRPGKLIVLSGPGGVGKSTVAKALRERGEFWVSISATTRPPRSNEVPGDDYLFLSEDEFTTAIESAQFLEWAPFAGARYGTPKAPVEAALRAGKSVLLEIDIAGAKQVKAHVPSALLIFLEPPSWEDLVSRLEGRGTDSVERRAARLTLAQEELAAAAFFDKVLVNDEVERVVTSLISFVSA